MLACEAFEVLEGAPTVAFCSLMLRGSEGTHVCCCSRRSTLVCVAPSQPPQMGHHTFNLRGRCHAARQTTLSLHVNKSVKKRKGNQSAMFVAPEGRTAMVWLAPDCLGLRPAVVLGLPLLLAFGLCTAFLVWLLSSIPWALSARILWLILVGTVWALGLVSAEGCVPAGKACRVYVELL